MLYEEGKLRHISLCHLYHLFSKVKNTSTCMSVWLFSPFPVFCCCCHQNLNEAASHGSLVFWERVTPVVQGHKEWGAAWGLHQ